LAVDVLPDLAETAQLEEAAGGDMSSTVRPRFNKHSRATARSSISRAHCIVHAADRLKEGLAVFLL